MAPTSKQHNYMGAIFHSEVQSHWLHCSLMGIKGHVATKSLARHGRWPTSMEAIPRYFIHATNAIVLLSFKPPLPLPLHPLLRAASVS